MFWQYVFSNNSAQIEKLLQKDDVTLEELMEEEELLQECQAQNKKLVDFLCQDSVLLELVTLVVTEPSNDMEYQVRFKHASLAAELLSAEVPTVVDKLGASEELLAVLCKFLSNDKPLNPLLASFFSKVLGMLMHRRSEQNWYQYQVTCFRVLDFLKVYPDFVEQVAQHIGTSAIMNLLHKLLCGVDEEQVRSRIHAWFSETPLITLLISKLGPENEWCEQANVEHLLCDVMDTGGGGCGLTAGGVNSAPINGATSNGDNATVSDTSALLPLIMNEDVVQQLMAVLLHEQGTPSSISHSCNILMKMLNIHSCAQCSQYADSLHHPQQVTTATPPATHSSSDSSDPGCDEGAQQQQQSPAPQFCVARAVAEALPQIHNMIVTPNKLDQVQTSYGSSVDRVGSTRLRLISLVSCLIQTKHFHIHNTLAQLETLPHILELFFRYPQNNFLHSLVQRCITELLSGSSCTTPAPSLTPPQTPPHEVMDTNSPPLSSTTTITNDTPCTTDITSTSNITSTTITPMVHILGSEVQSTTTAPVDTSYISSLSDVTTESSNIFISSNNDTITNTTTTTTTTSTATTTTTTCSSSTSSSSNISSSISTSSSSCCNRTATTTVTISEDSSCSVWDPTIAEVSAAPVSCDTTVSQEESHPLLCQIMKQANLLPRILYTYHVQIPNYSAVGVDSPPAGSLCGYRGHVRLLANSLRDNTLAGPNAPLLTQLIQSLDDSVQTAWQNFIIDELAQDNALNEVTPISSHDMTHMVDESDDDDLHRPLHSFPLSTKNESMLQITEDDLQTDNKDMIINAMTHSLSFDDNGFDSAASEGATISGDGGPDQCPASPEPGMDDDGSRLGDDNTGATSSSPPQDVDLFEKMCFDNFNKQQEHDLTNMWNDKERQIIFAADGDDKEIAERTSSDEEEDEEEEDGEGVKRGAAASMEVDELQDEWESLFDRRNSDQDIGSSLPEAKDVPVTSASPRTPTVDTPPAEFPGFNPWQTAPSSDTTGDDTSWASFGTASFPTVESDGAGPLDSSAMSGEAFGRVNFEPTFGSNNPFEAAPTGSLRSPTKNEDPFSFHAKFPDLIKPDSSTGIGSVGTAAAAPVAADGPAQNSFLSQLGGLKSTECETSASTAITTNDSKDTVELDDPAINTVSDDDRLDQQEKQIEESAIKMVQPQTRELVKPELITANESSNPPENMEVDYADVKQDTPQITDNPKTTSDGNSTTAD